MESSLLAVDTTELATLIRFTGDSTNTLSTARVRALTEALTMLRDTPQPRPVIITGNEHFFSAGADLNEIARLDGHSAYEFAIAGQRLMNVVSDFPAVVIAAIHGYCMGGGLDLALACHLRIAGPRAIFGHRGAALGLVTGWGGTQRLPRLIGKARALQMFVCAEKLSAREAHEMRLVDELAEDPVQRAFDRLSQRSQL